MAALNFKTWDSSSTFSSRLKMTSKYTDLGHPDTKKSLLGVMCNISIGTESTASSHSRYSFTINYRTSPNENFTELATFNNVYNPTITNRGNVQIIKILKSPIINILNVQLQIKGGSIRNDFGINDLGLIFREYRTSNVVSLDEG